MLCFVGLIHAPEVGWAAAPKVALGYLFFGLVCLACSWQRTTRSDPDPAPAEAVPDQLPRGDNRPGPAFPG